MYFSQIWNFITYARHLAYSIPKTPTTIWKLGLTRDSSVLVSSFFRLLSIKWEVSSLSLCGTFCVPLTTLQCFKRVKQWPLVCRRESSAGAFVRQISAWRVRDANYSILKAPVVDLVDFFSPGIADCLIRSVLFVRSLFALCKWIIGRKIRVVKASSDTCWRIDAASYSACPL